MRRALDAYYTPDELALKLVERVLLWGTVLEPHVGGGAFARAIRSEGARHLIGVDVNPEAPGLAMVDQPIVGDFLDLPIVDGVDWIVGNPPYAGFERHLDRALATAPNVAMLLRLSVLESASRVSSWQRWPLQSVTVLAQRPSFTGGGTDSAAYGWFVFRRGWHKLPVIVPAWSWR